jgi:hypothetical protein
MQISVDAADAIQGAEAAWAAEISKLKASEPVTNLNLVVPAHEIDGKHVGARPVARLLPPPAQADPDRGKTCGAAGKGRRKCGRPVLGAIRAGALSEGIDAPSRESIAERQAAIEASLTMAAYGGTPDSVTAVELMKLGLPFERLDGAYASQKVMGSQVPTATDTPACLFHLSAVSLEALHPDDESPKRRKTPQAVQPPPEPVYMLSDLDPWKARATDWDPNFVFVTDGTKSVQCSHAEYKAAFGGRHPGAGTGSAAHVVRI